MDLKIFSTSARLQHAQNQYESLLIRAGEIIEHVPNPANMHNMNYNNNANQFHSDAGGLDTSYDSVEETYSVNDNGCYEHSTITHRHTQQWHGAGNEAEPGAGPDVDIGMRQQPSVRFDFSGKIPAAGLISPSGLGIGSVGGIGSNYSSRTASPTISSSSGGVGGAYVPTTTTSPSSSHTPLPKPPPVPMPAFARNDSDGFALSVEEDEKLTIIITLQAEVHRLKNKLETTITSAEETIGDLYQAHSTAELAHANAVSSLTKQNARLQQENDVLRQQLTRSQKELETEKMNLLEATHLIRRLHSRHKIITHGLLPHTQTNRKKIVGSSGKGGTNKSNNNLFSPVTGGSGGRKSTRVNSNRSISNVARYMTIDRTPQK